MRPTNTTFLLVGLGFVAIALLTWALGETSYVPGLGEYGWALWLVGAAAFFWGAWRPQPPAGE